VCLQGTYSKQGVPWRRKRPIHRICRKSLPSTRQEVDGILSMCMAPLGSDRITAAVPEPSPVICTFETNTSDPDPDTSRKRCGHLHHNQCRQCETIYPSTKRLSVTNQKITTEQNMKDEGSCWRHNYLSSFTATNRLTSDSAMQTRCY
jgi:hypothetical protein